MTCARFLAIALTLAAAACAAPAPQAVQGAAARPLDVLPADAQLATVRADLLSTARERYGTAAVERATAAAAYLVVKRYVGMVPPPPPGAGPDWKPATPSAMLMQDNGRWLVASPSGWRPASAEAAATLEALTAASSRLWTEPAVTPPCPDFGASNALLKVPGRVETVRKALCSSAAEELVRAALDP